MRARLITTLFATAATAAVLGAGAGVAAASPAKAAVKVVPIAMHDPGCHWFYVNGKYEKSLAVAGKTTFFNTDEATLIFNGAKFHKLLPVGKKITLAKPGTYHVTMVGQAPDDNHLLLVVKK